MEKQIRREMEVYDTVIFSRRCFPEETRHNLDIICNRLNLAFNANERHRSMEDVRLTAHAFVRMREMLGDSCPSRERWEI